jgi:branched-chain amino acid transport system substrate-binding protein
MSVPASAASVKIAVGVPLSGRPASLGREMANAAKLAVEDASRAEGLALEAWIVDDKGDEAAGCAAARAFVADGSVVGLVGHYNSNVSLAAGDIYADAGLAVVAPIVSNPRLTESGWSNVFRFTNRDDATARAIAQHARQVLGKGRAMVVATKTVYGGSMSNEFIRAFRQQGGAILGCESVEEGACDFSWLVRALPSEADIVFYGGTFEGAPLVRAMRAAGRMQLLATGDGCWDLDNFVEPAGDAAESGDGVLVLSACPAVGTVEGASAFVERYERRFGRVINYAVNAYDATRTLAKAVADAALKTGALPDRAGVVEALRKLTRQGIAYAAPISWDANGENEAAVTALHIVKDGRFRQVVVIPRDEGLRQHQVSSAAGG